MSVGIIELAFLNVVGAGAGVSFFTGKQRWLVPMFGFCVIAAIFSPADIVSTLLLALSVFAIHWFSMKRRLRTG